MASRTKVVSLPTRFHEAFDELTRVRGWEYADAGRVTLTTATATAVTGIVRGGREYAVAIVARPRGMHASCTCPFYAKGSFCKHLWATLLIAERRGSLQELLARADELLHDADAVAGDELAGDLDFDADSPPLSGLEPDADDADDADDVDDADDFDERGAPRPRVAAAGAPAPSPASPRARGPRPVDWRRFLASLPGPPDHEAPPAAPGRSGPRLGGRPLLYALNVAAALNQNCVELLLLDRWRRKDGALTTPRAVRLTRREAATLPDPEDRRIVGLLLGAPGTGYDGYGYYYDPGTAMFSLHEAHVASLLPDVCRTGRLFLCRGALDVDEAPCSWDEAPHTVRLRLEERAGDYVLGGTLESDGTSLPLSAVTLLLQGGVCFYQQRAARFACAGHFAWIARLRAHGEVPIPRAEVDDFLDALYAAGTIAGVELPAALRPAELTGTPRPVLRLRRAHPAWGGARDPGKLTAGLAFAYDDLEAASRDPRPALYDRASRRLLVRDRAAEDAARAVLPGLGFRPVPPQAYRYQRHEGADFELAAGKLSRAVPALLAAGFHVEAEAGAYRAAGAISVSVSSGLDWFDVDGGVAFGDEVVSFPRLLKAAKAGARFVTLRDGGLGVLPEEWLRRNALLLGAGTTHASALRFGRSQTLLLDALLAAETEVTADAAFTALRARLREFHGVALRTPPRTFRGTLRPYQQAGLGWLHFLRDHGLGGCLADDMGLGKTVQILAYLESRRRERVRPSLVVAPRSVLFNWQAEAQRFTPKLRVVVHDGATRRRAGLDFGAADLVLTTYGILRRDAAALTEARFDCVILDEAQAIKNAASATAKAARLVKGEQRLALSGTPIENHLGELWSLMEFLNPGMLGSARVFRAALAEGAAGDPAARDLLARALKPMLLRRTKGDVAPELPERVEQVVAVELEPAERARYDELRAHYQRTLLGGAGADLGRARFHVLEALLRLRQAACHGGLLDPRLAKGPSAKLTLLREQLREVVDEGHKALVFSQFTSFLALVKAALDHDGIPYEYLDGRTRDRAARVARFQNDPACPVFLVSLKAGGLGLNLTAAEYVFLLDPWWNPAVEAQAIDRTHRIGQLRSVFAYRLVASDTVEEKVLALQRSKRDLADAILRADRSLLQDLTREDLQLLLS